MVHFIKVFLCIRTDTVFSHFPGVLEVQNHILYEIGTESYKEKVEIKIEVELWAKLHLSREKK